MKRILLSAATLFCLHSGAFAQDAGRLANPQHSSWQRDDVYGNNRHDDDDDDDDRYERHDKGRHYGYDRGYWKAKKQGRYASNYVQNHPVYRRVLSARLPVREGHRVEKELYRLRQMEARFAYNGQLGPRERAILDRELMRLDAQVARYYQRGYAWR